AVCTCQPVRLGAFPVAYVCALQCRGKVTKGRRVVEYHRGGDRPGNQEGRRCSAARH
ncbi:unnamed protein product, partial [Amoebophrya sp. A120]